MRIRAVIFDLGETLLNYGVVDLENLFSKGAHLSYDYLSEQANGANSLPDFGRYRRNHLSSIKLRAIWSKITGREFDCLELLGRKTAQMGLRLSDRQVEELARLWYQPLGETATIEPDLHDSLLTLQREMGLSLAIISNTFLPPAVLDRQLEKFDLLRFFSIRQYSSATVYRKPDRRIFRTALDQLQVPAGKAVMVGDSLREDIKGAVRMGLGAIFKRHEQNRSVRVPHSVPVIERIAELPDLIRNELSGRIVNVDSL